VRADGTPKPAYHALRRQIRGEWWLSPTTVVADDEGRIVVEGFAGDYLVHVADDQALVDLHVPGAVEREVAIG
jgi:endo-1,4-beta-xylanase